MNSHWGLQRTEEPIDSISESSPSEEEPLFLDPDIDIQTQEEQDNTFDLSHQLLASLIIPQIPTPPSSTLISIQPVFPFLPLPPSPTPPPPPLVIPSPTTMTTTTKPIKLHISIPESYDGFFKTSKQWINAVQLYLLVNAEVYNNDDKEITFILSYMTKGFALTWAATFCKNAINATGTVTISLTYILMSIFFLDHPIFSRLPALSGCAWYPLYFYIIDLPLCVPLWAIPSHHDLVYKPSTSDHLFLTLVLLELSPSPAIPSMTLELY